MRALSVWKLSFVTAVLTSACALSVVAASAQGLTCCTRATRSNFDMPLCWQVGSNLTRYGSLSLGLRRSGLSMVLCW